VYAASQLLPVCGMVRMHKRDDRWWTSVPVEAGSVPEEVPRGFFRPACAVEFCSDKLRCIFVSSCLHLHKQRMSFSMRI
jgi:hypothetical protein